MSKKRSFMIIFVLIMSIFAAWPMNNVSANILIPHEPDFEWGIDINDFLGFEIDTIEGPFAGTKWMRGFELNMTYPYWSDPYWLSRANFTELIYSLEHDCIEDSGRVRGYQFNSTHGFYFDFNSVLDMYEPIFAPVIILPLNRSSTVDLNFWGNFLTSNYENYNEYYNLTQYEVSGNELKCYNSTTGDYINATYDPNNGTLISAEISVYKYYGPYWTNYVQRYSRFYDETVGLHPLDETASTLDVGDSLIYNEGYDEIWVYKSYNITSIEESISEYSGQDFPAIQVNASLHYWNQLWEMWELDDESDPFIEKSIGGGSDFGMQVSMYDSGTGSLIYPAGITRELLNATLSPMYSMYGGLGESEIGPWSVKLFNSTSNQFLYIELDGDSGILKNMTFTMGEYVSSRIRSNEEELPHVEEIYYTIHASTGINGDINPKGDIEVLEGGDMSFDFSPDTGYLVDDVVVDGGSVGNLSSYTFNNINSNHTIEVTFKEDPDYTPPNGDDDTDITIPGYSLIFFLLINCAIVSVITILIHRRRLN